MSVDYDVTDTKRAILSVKKGRDRGSVVIFTAPGGKIINDPKAIEKINQITLADPRLDIIHDKGAYVLDVPNETDVPCKDGPLGRSHR